MKHLEPVFLRAGQYFCEEDSGQPARQHAAPGVEQARQHAAPGVEQARQQAAPGVEIRPLQQEAYIKV